ncbi:hypothetical protein [Streptomyces sp. NPDC093225]|uniref:hypothetical protein n=1 Tax=Streptomyces sp. NPDC093225 TaxID=3366034 RepID=UPI003814C5D8
MRLRIRLSDDRRTVVLTDTPHPQCPNCEGEGGFTYDYGDPETGEYAGTEWDLCPCWDSTRRWPLLRLPRRLTSGATSHGYSDEPPF